MDVNEFKAKLQGAGARPNLFRVTLNFPSYANGDVELASFMCKAATLPQSQLGEVQLNYRGRQIFFPGDRTFEPWEVTIINDTNFAVRDALVEWSKGINDHASNTADVDPSQYYADLAVEQLDRDGSTLKRYDIRGAFPTLIGQIELSNDTENQIEEFTTTFRYLYWE